LILSVHFLAEPRSTSFLPRSLASVRALSEDMTSLFTGEATFFGLGFLDSALPCTTKASSDFHQH